MMPISHRVDASFDAVTAQSVVTRPRTLSRSANSSTLAIVVATTFALVTALISLMPDAVTRARADDLSLAPLRGTLPAIGDTTR